MLERKWIKEQQQNVVLKKGEKLDGWEWNKMLPVLDDVVSDHWEDNLEKSKMNLKL